MPNRKTYWSCTNFADWLRGNPKPEAGTGQEWHQWHKESKKKHPVRYWLAEEALDKVQSLIWWPIDQLYNIKYYINNRWVTHTHALTAHNRDIPRGEWRDVGNRFLPCLFNELANYVEIELAWWHIAWSDKEERKKYDAPFWATGWFRWRTWRCPQAGLDNLEWQCNLVWKEEEFGEDSPNIGKPTYQAIKAKEILELYRWWTQIYPNRPDPYEVSGWTAYCDQRRQSDDGLFSEPTDKNAKKQRNQSLKLLDKIKQDYEKEDEKMLIRLIKVRNSLWT